MARYKDDGATVIKRATMEGLPIETVGRDPPSHAPNADR